MHNKIIKMCVGLTLFLQACTTQVSYPTGGHDETIYVITDLHYLAKDLYRKDSGTFQQILATNDSKMIEEMPSILSAFVEKVCVEKPRAVLVCGDITFNGEMLSLQEVKQYFDQIEEAGVDVLVIPGNHDIKYPYAESYLSDVPVYVDDISQKQFRREMKNYGLQEAVSCDASSFSYLYPLTEDLYVMAIDVNTEKTPGSISETTKKWMEEAFALAQKNNARVITMSHQNVLKHSDVIYKGYVINHHEEAVQQLKKHGVFLNLSGHSHLQHTSVDGTLTDICNESLAVYPLSYGIVTQDGQRQSFTYERKSVDLPLQQAKDRFLNRTLTQTAAQLANIDAPKEILDQMAAFVAEINLEMFTGNSLDKEMILKDERWKDWQKYGKDTFWYSYIQKFLESQD